MSKDVFKIKITKAHKYTHTNTYNTFIDTLHSFIYFMYKHKYLLYIYIHMYVNMYTYKQINQCILVRVLYLYKYMFFLLI